MKPVFLYLVIVAFCNFQLSVEYNPGLLWFYFIFLCNWSRKLASLSQPIRCKTKTNRDLVTCVFPRFGYLRFPALWLRAFSRALVSLPVSSQRLFSLFLVSHWDYNGFGLTTLNLSSKLIVILQQSIAVSSIGREILADKRGCYLIFELKLRLLIFRVGACIVSFLVRRWVCTKIRTTCK